MGLIWALFLIWSNQQNFGVSPFQHYSKSAIPFDGMFLRQPSARTAYTSISQKLTGSRESNTVGPYAKHPYQSSTVAALRTCRAFIEGAHQVETGISCAFQEWCFNTFHMQANTSVQCINYCTKESPASTLSFALHMLRACTNEKWFHSSLVHIWRGVHLPASI